MEADVHSTQKVQMRTFHCVVMLAHLQLVIRLISAKNALTPQMVNQHVFIREQHVVSRLNGRVLRVQ